MRDLPTGTLTFLFTDIEGSTHLWERHPAAMKTALGRHDAILRAAIEANSGCVFKTVGDAFYAAFTTAPDALSAALAAQRDLRHEAWGEMDPLRVRMALHTGAAEERDGDYFGPPLNRVARLLAAGHGSQTLLSLATQELVRDHLPEDTELRDLGEHRLRDLLRPERIYQLVAPDLPTDFPPLRTLDIRPNNLPAQATPFIGREKEVRAIRERLLRSEVRLLTLTGPGGTGKTRLSLQVAADLLDEFADGVFFVPLASIVDPHLVPSSIAQALGIAESGHQPILDTLKAHLRDRRLLLLLDNFEQVASAAPLVAELPAAAPGLKLLVTSRFVLHVYGEHDYPVPPLTLPDPQHLPPIERLTQYEAVSLFIARAQAAEPDFTVNTQNAPAIAEICHRLDGLPLAIELAVARIRLLPPQAMLARLERRLPVLTGGARDLPARQRTLRGAIDWSFDLLNECEQTLFARLSVFVGGCTLEAAEAVCQAADTEALQTGVLDGLESLVDKSLLSRIDAGGESRFTTLETIREYALEHLEASGEAERLRRQHAAYYLQLAETVEPELRGPQQPVWLKRLEDDHDNLRAALGWALAHGESETAARLSVGVVRFWLVHGYLSEGRRWLDQVLADGETLSEPVRAKALNAAATLAWAQGDYARARPAFEESLALNRKLENKRGIASALNNLALIALSQDDYEQARPAFEESLALSRELEDNLGVAITLGNLGLVASNQNDLERAAALLDEAVECWRKQGDRSGMTNVLINLGRVALYQGKQAQAVGLFEESLALGRELGDRRIVALSLNNLGLAAMRQGAYERAIALFDESLALSREIGDKWVTAISLFYLGRVALEQGALDKAAPLLEDGLALGRELGHKWTIANSLGSLGRIALERDEATRAMAAFKESIALQHLMTAHGDIAECLEGLAGAAVSQGQAARAAQLLGAADMVRQTYSAPALPIIRTFAEGTAAAARARLGEAESAAAWTAGEKMTLNEAVAFALS